MSKYYYFKKNHSSKKLILRMIALVIFCAGIGIALYAFLPLISWNIYFAPAFAAQSFTIPIPKTTLVKALPLNALTKVIESATTDYTDARTWFPNATRRKNDLSLKNYSISIPKLHIQNAVVTAEDNDLSKHLVHFEGTTLPPQNGNTVIFGHSTLPQLFNPQDYKTIFANAYLLKTGDEFFLNVSQVLYSYKIATITVVDPEDTSIFSQDYDSSYVTLVTCTPPGTTWKRLVVKAKIEKI